MSTSHLTIEQRDHQSLWITLNRPKVHNAFNNQVIAELTQALKEASENNNIRSIVLAANGKSFSAGADLNWMRSMASYTEAENIEDSRKLFQLIHTLRHCSKPTIARVQGSAYGGGLGLIAACDITAALPETQFALTEVNLGLVPAVISPVVIERIGNHARRLFLTAERINSDEAHRLGLIDYIAQTESDLDNWINLRTKLISKTAPKASASAKQLATNIINNHYDDLETGLAELIAKHRVSVEGQQRMQSFLNKT
jgi:methylglutaconyl-CoA hydratase